MQCCFTRPILVGGFSDCCLYFSNGFCMTSLKDCGLFVWIDIDSKLVMDLAAPNMEGMANGLGALDKGNASSSSKARKKSMTSVYLKYFETAPDGKTRRCKFCCQSYSIATATGIEILPFLIFPCANFFSRHIVSENIIHIFSTCKSTMTVILLLSR